MDILLNLILNRGLTVAKKRYTLLGIHGYHKLRVTLDSDPVFGTILEVNGRKYESVGRECDQPCNCWMVFPVRNK